MSHLCPFSLAPMPRWRGFAHPNVLLHDLVGRCIPTLEQTLDVLASPMCYTMPPVPYTPTTMAGRADYLQVGTHWQGFALCAVCTTGACQPLPQGGV